MECVTFARSAPHLWQLVHSRTSPALGSGTLPHGRCGSCALSSTPGATLCEPHEAVKQDNWRSVLLLSQRLQRSTAARLKRGSYIVSDRHTISATPVVAGQLAHLPGSSACSPSGAAAGTTALANPAAVVKAPVHLPAERYASARVMPAPVTSRARRSPGSAAASACPRRTPTPGTVVSIAAAGLTAASGTRLNTHEISKAFGLESKWIRKILI